MSVRSRARGRVRAAAAAAALLLSAGSAHAETLLGALAQAYQNNPQLNAQRAAVRAVDENVPTALSGYRPRVSATASATQNWLDTNTIVGNNRVRTTGSPDVYSYGATLTQTLWNGFQTASRTRQAEAQVHAARETLRLTEQSVLLSAATAYMNLLRDTAIFDLQRRNVEVLQEQLRQTRDRFDVGEVTRTDVAQSESRLAAGRSAMLAAQSNVTTSRAIYRQVIGVDPGRLMPGTPVDRFSPAVLAQAVAQARELHPSVTAAQYNVDVALQQVKVAEGALYPTVNMIGSASKTYGSAQSLNTIDSFNATFGGQVSVPIYQGGAEYAAIRQSKETLGQRRIELDVNREQTQQTAVQSWGQLEAAKAQIRATQSQVEAAEIALNGVREEARVGQRTTLDVLNAQQELVNARVAMVSAQRDRVVASYALLAAVGRLSVQVLGLRVQIYDPVVHYHQVRDSWTGVRTPDGR